MKTQIIFIILSFSFSFVSCKQKQIINYTTNNIERYLESASFTISIQPFEDIRSESEINLIQIQAKNIIQKINGKRSCINIEKLYSIPLEIQMTYIFAAHLSQKTDLIDVLINQKEITDYYITCKLKHFYSAQKFSTKPAVKPKFGLIGPLVSSELKTEGNIIIELSDICLYDNKSNLIADIGNFKKEYTGIFPFDTNCNCIYNNINLKLIEFNEELTHILLTEINNDQKR